MCQLTRDHMSKCDETKYLSNNGSVKNNTYHHKILVLFANNIELIKTCLGLVSPPHFVYDFSRKMFLMLHAIN